MVAVGLKPNRNDTLNRRSWDSPKLSSQLEEEEATDSAQDEKAETVSLKSNKSPIVTKKDDKETMFSRLKNLRKGTDN